MLLIPILIIALAAGFMVFLFLNRADRLPHPPDPVLEKASLELAQKKTAYEKLEQSLFEQIDKKFGKKYIQDIKDGMISVGMPSEFLLMAWGKPAETAALTVYNGTGEKWVYHQVGSNGKQNHTEVILLNNKVDGWKDI
ncbi:hypothetical protein A8C56_16685 [Niabella ginsenosidivorans]|uniref:Uncharacterized protein n=1 Tax=Niabella ginsenosidivorans TaxID=1176587 RepID=A0A1A9I4A8_9BACT|nr:hypothetical protein [Niabella ginsenosidivorans]ANH82383.1 hypothetical protein A8C56_16685 [Niabella ginsenosidivorans]